MKLKQKTAVFSFSKTQQKTKTKQNFKGKLLQDTRHKSLRQDFDQPLMLEQAKTGCGRGQVDDAIMDCSWLLLIPLCSHKELHYKT